VVLTEALPPPEKFSLSGFFRQLFDSPEILFHPFMPFSRSIVFFNTP
jgi:hypothetical protein